MLHISNIQGSSSKLEYEVKVIQKEGQLSDKQTYTLLKNIRLKFG